MQDTDADDVAVCAKNFNSRQTCSIQLINEKFDNYSLVMHTILHT